MKSFVLLLSVVLVSGQNLTWNLSPIQGIDPTARYQFAATLHEGQPVVFGGVYGTLRNGEELSDLYRYSIQRDLWEPITVTGTKPSARYGACLDSQPGTNYLYLFGGSNSQTAFNEMWRFDFLDNSWELLFFPTGTSRPSPRYAHVSFLRNNSIYYFGGMSNSAGLRDMWKFDLASLTWSSVPTVNTDMAFLGGEGFSGKYDINTDAIYVFGGYPHIASEGKSVRYTVKYDFLNSTWTRLNATAAFNATTNMPIARQYHMSWITDNKLYIFGGYSDRLQRDINSIHALDLTTLFWTEVHSGFSPAPGARDASVVIPLMDTNNTVFLFGGTGDAVYNDVWMYNGVFNSWRRLRLGYMHPPPRYGHVMAKLNTLMIVHGGAGSSGDLLGDLWTYDTISGTWTQISVPGAIPSPRRGHCGAFVGDQFFIFGGIGADGLLLSDLWMYDAVGDEGWTLITPPITSDLPPARFGGALATDGGLMLYLIGGQGSVESYGDVWRLDLTSNVWTDISPRYRPSGRFNFGFVANNANGTLRFTMFGGLDSGFTQLNDVWVYNVAVGNWTGYKTDLLTRSNMAFFPTGSRFVSFGGLNYADLLNDLVEISLVTNRTGNYAITTALKSNTSDVNRAPSFLAGGTVARIRDLAYIFGGVVPVSSAFGSASTAMSSLTSNRIYTLKLAPMCPPNSGTKPTTQREANDCYLCASGSYAIRNTSGVITCELCPPGQYTDQPGMLACSSCAAGFYSPRWGLASSLSCSSCPAGKFSNRTGMSFCYNCRTGYICPPASTKEINTDSITSEINSQPESYKTKTAEVKQQQFVVVMVGVGIFGFFLLVLFLLPYHYRTEYLPVFDIFAKNHIPLIQEQRVLKEWQTPLGGLMGILAALLVIFFAISQALVWRDNQIELRSLIPNIVTDGQCFGKLTLTAGFESYGGACAIPGTTTCMPDIGDPITTNGIVFGNEWDNSTEKTSLSCSSTTAAPCTVTWVCNNCTLSVAQATVLFSLNQPYSFATAVAFTLSATSGVPGQLSSFSSLLTADTDAAGQRKSFRGTTPSVVSFKMTQTQYRDATRGYNDTGYHIEFVKQAPGSQVTSREFQYVRSLQFQFELNKADASFSIVREPVLNEVTFTSNVLGGISGLMGAMAAILVIVEKLHLRVEKGKVEELEQQIGRPFPLGLPFAAAEKEVDYFSSWVDDTHSDDWVMGLVFDRARKIHLKNLERAASKVGAPGNVTNVELIGPAGASTGAAGGYAEVGRPQPAVAMPAPSIGLPGAVPRPATIKRLQSTMTQWECPACTYLNRNKATKCDVCLTPRPAAGVDVKVGSAL